MQLSGNKKGVNMVVLVVAVVAIVGVASVAGYLILTGENSSVGEYSTYVVLGNNGSSSIDGTFTIKIVDENSSQYQIQYDYAMYMTTSGKRTAFYIDSEREWEDKEDYESPGVKTGSEVISTKWGNRNADIYTKVIDGETTKVHIGKDGILYRIEMNIDGVSLIFVLTSTNLIKGNPGDGVGDYAVYSVSGSAAGVVYDGITFMIIVNQSATQYQVQYDQAIYGTVLGVRTPLVVNSEKIWEDMDDDGTMGVKTGTETITTEWGARLVDIYTQVVDGDTTKTYVGRSDGVSYRMTITSAGSTMTFNLVGTNLL
ncbi:MAG: hypothetical protein FWD37_00430 [Methanomassiliicoccaceae archaeon]|nr:hypothetical protein [Methanomassiliicoccaceae archaeon]